MKWNLVVPFILGMVDVILKWVFGILIGIFVPVGIVGKLICMSAAILALAAVDVVVYAGVEKRHKQDLENLARKHEEEISIPHIQKHYQEQISNNTQAKTMDNVPLEVESYVGINLKQLVYILDTAQIDLDTYLEIRRLYAEVDEISQRIMVTTNKQELMKLKQKLIPLQFKLQDTLVSCIEQEHKSPKKKV